MLTLTQYSEDISSAKYLYLNEDGQFYFSIVSAENAQIQTSIEGKYEFSNDNLVLDYSYDGGNQKAILNSVDGQFHNNDMDTPISGIWEKNNAEVSEEETFSESFSNGSLCSWMSSLPDSLRLMQLSIPGTHDSCTKDVYYLDSARTQKQDISTQLNDGIRYLDFRIGHSCTTEELELFHGAAKCHMTFRQGMEKIAAFLRQNPGETVFLSIQKETHEQGNFADECSSVLSGFRQFIYPGHDLPSLGAARGKIILLASSAEISFMGINISGLRGNEGWTSTKSGNVSICANTTYCVLDDWHKVEQRVRRKEDYIKGFLDGQTWAAATLDLNNWNHQWTPGHSIQEYAGLINGAMRNSGYFNNTRHHGIQIMDYYESEIVKEIIRNNYQFMK